MARLHPLLGESLIRGRTEPHRPPHSAPIGALRGTRPSRVAAPTRPPRNSDGTFPRLPSFKTRRSSGSWVVAVVR